MRRPDGFWEQHAGKAQAELCRGCGLWPHQDQPCALEPPHDVYDPNAVSPWDCLTNGWEGPVVDHWLKHLLPSSPVLPRHHSIALPPARDDYFNHSYTELALLTFEQFVEDQATIPKAEQLLLALSAISHPVAFEILGLGPQPEWDVDKASEILERRAGGEKRRIREAIRDWTDPYTVTQFCAHRSDLALLKRQLATHYPNSAVVEQGLDEHPCQPGQQLAICEGTLGATLALRYTYAAPLRVFTRLDPDPLAVAVAAMEDLERDQWALLQVLFQPAIAPWSDTLFQAIANPYKPGEFWSEPQEVKLFREKFSAPLFAVSIRLAASHRSVFEHLQGWAQQFTNAPHQTLVVNDVEWEDDRLPEDERSALACAIENRCTFRPGILLNLQELASMVHLPAQPLASERLRRVKTRTRPAVHTGTEPGSVVLGENLHRGQTKVARIPAKLRPRHCYVAGASGTGKSTLLLNMIVQDIEAGAGVGLLDPHGDLVQAVLRRIPPHRIKDVILFDPADEEFPFALNILDFKDDAERERIVAETVMALERYFPSSWGPRLERILTYTIHTVLQTIPGATLADVERMLTDEVFRSSVVANTKDPRLLQFWTSQFRFFPKNATDPVLNKLSVFLISRTVRNIICQRHCSVDFDELLNGNKILLANLSTGLLTEKIAGMLGSFLVTKIVNAAFRRARIPEHQRQPWYLYIDEFQAFMNLSVGFDRILAEARKYKLVLAGLANQYVGQISPAVRQAIFGNVGTFVVFRLGVDDAHTVAREMGAFTAEEILNLELGQAIARAGGAATAFNIETYPEPPVSQADPTTRVVAACRRSFAASRIQVEKELGDLIRRADDLEADSDDAPEPSDPSEDDLVS